MTMAWRGLTVSRNVMVADWLVGGHWMHDIEFIWNPCYFNETDVEFICIYTLCAQ